MNNGGTPAVLDLLIDTIILYMANTEHSEKFKMVENFYIRGAWSIKRMRNAVVKNWITSEEFKQITGEDYEH